MEVTLLVARVLLAAVFFLAAVAKLADRKGARRAALEFGVPAAVATPFAFLLPLAELAVAGALLPGASARWGALGALALLLVFVAAIALNLARGRKPDCRCFGQLSSSPVGWTTLVRNGVLAGAAAFIVSQGQDQADPSAVDLSGL